MILIFDKYRGALNLSAAKFMRSGRKSLLVTFPDGSRYAVHRLCILTLEGLMSRKSVIDYQWRQLKKSKIKEDDNETT